MSSIEAPHPISAPLAVDYNAPMQRQTLFGTASPQGYGPRKVSPPSPPMRPPVTAVPTPLAFAPPLQLFPGFMPGFGAPPPRPPMPAVTSPINAANGAAARNKGVICSFYFEKSTCPVPNCPFAHIIRGTELPVPTAVCSFYKGSATSCLRDHCKFFHGTESQLRQLQSLGKPKYRPEDYMVVCNPFAPGLGNTTEIPTMTTPAIAPPPPRPEYALPSPGYSMFPVQPATPPQPPMMMHHLTTSNGTPLVLPPGAVIVMPSPLHHLTAAAQFAGSKQLADSGASTAGLSETPSLGHSNLLNTSNRSDASDFGPLVFHPYPS